jgi:hypothetical protein
MTDRRNELAGNLSLNQELYFVRRTNELVRRCGHYEDGVFKLSGGRQGVVVEYRGAASGGGFYRLQVGAS